MSEEIDGCSRWDGRGGEGGAGTGWQRREETEIFKQERGKQVAVVKLEVDEGIRGPSARGRRKAGRSERLGRQRKANEGNCERRTRTCQSG